MNILKKTFIILFISLGILSSISVWAADPYGLSSAGDQAGLTKLTISSKSIPQFAGEIVGTGLSLIGIIFFLLMLYAGIRWMIAMGKSEDVQKAKDILEAAAIGLVIVLSAYAITQFVFSNLGVGDGGATTGEIGPPAPSNLLSCTTNNDCDFGDVCTDGYCYPPEGEVGAQQPDTACYVVASRSCEVIPVNDCAFPFNSIQTCISNSFASCDDCCKAKCIIGVGSANIDLDCYEECQFCVGSPRYQNAYNQCSNFCAGANDRKDRSKCKG